MMHPSLALNGQKSRPHAWPLDITTRQPSCSAYCTAFSMAGLGCLGLVIGIIYPRVDMRQADSGSSNQDADFPPSHPCRVAAAMVQRGRVRKRAGDRRLSCKTLTPARLRTECAPDTRSGPQRRREPRLMYRSSFGGGFARGRRAGLGVGRSAMSGLAPQPANALEDAGIQRAAVQHPAPGGSGSEIAVRFEKRRHGDEDHTRQPWGLHHVHAQMPRMGNQRVS